MKIWMSIAAVAAALSASAQHEDATADSMAMKIFRESVKKVNDVVHTKLDVRFDYAKSYMYGKEWLTLKPHVNPTDSVLLDAKGMTLNQVAIVNGTNRQPLKYTYDGMQINIKLDKTYKASQPYTLYFDYVSKPDELKVKGSAAITDAKGLYFINPRNEEPNKPQQIWTQGETESSSAWMVTIDNPGQKSTSEISMTVPAKYVTLSNGLKTSEKKNADGTRTDTWKMDLPHAPYLFFMGVGDFTIVKDVPYKGKEVSYYVEPDQAKYAKAVFGNTPEMIKFFSEKLGVEFPWQKYSQMVGRDYVSGAMENTTATLHGEAAYQNHRQLKDGNAWEDVIAHELFHQWFGDLVTAESWSNITVNESFADYSEYLWNEYKYGKDKAYEVNLDAARGYLMSNSNDKNLVRYHYKDKEDVFDAVSYNKGGRVLNMLRDYLGDEAFFKALNLYLTNNKFKTGEAHQLRLAFEETSGEDLNWFFNQWYFGAGQPNLDISYDNSTPGVAKMFVKQKQKNIFTIPVKVDVYENGVAQRYNIWVRNAEDTFSFPVKTKAELVNFDANKLLLATIKDNKTAENFNAQWRYAKNYMDRRDAIDYFAKNNSPELVKALDDPYAGLREYAISKLATGSLKTDASVLEKMSKLAATEKNSKARAAALNFLVKNAPAIDNAVFAAAVSDSSYSVAAAGLAGLKKSQPEQAYAMAKKYGSDAKGPLAREINNILYTNGTEADFDMITNNFVDGPLNQEKFMALGSYAGYVAKLNNEATVKKGIDAIIKVRNQIPEAYRKYVEQTVKSGLDKIRAGKSAAIGEYIDQKLK